jgi:hypothetical protein
MSAVSTGLRTALVLIYEGIFRGDAMPNRNTFDEQEKYDHSAHHPTEREPGDLAPVPKSKADDEPHRTSRAKRAASREALP